MQTDTASFCPVPEGRHHDHYACKQREFPRKHKNTKTFEASFNTKSKSYAPQPATLAGQEETPRWLSSIPKCLQSRNCCPAQKFPQKSTAPTHGTEWAPKPLHRMNKRMNVSSSEARTQPSSACGWTRDPPSNISTPVFPKFLHHPNRVFAQHTVHLKGKPSTSKAAAVQQA